METIGHREQSTEIDHFKVTVYYPVLDLFIAEVKRRFSDKNVELLKSIHACTPGSDDFLNPESMLPMAKFYELDLNTFSMESVLAKRCIKKDNGGYWRCVNRFVTF